MREFTNFFFARELLTKVLEERLSNERNHIALDLPQGVHRLPSSLRICRIVEATWVCTSSPCFWMVSLVSSGSCLNTSAATG